VTTYRQTKQKLQMKHEHVMTIMAIIISDLLLPMAQFPLDFLVYRMLCL